VSARRGTGTGMLTFVRRTEQFRIGDEIIVTVLQASRRGEVRIGIDAPRNVQVLRGELESRHPNKRGR